MIARRKFPLTQLVFARLQSYSVCNLIGVARAQMAAELSRQLIGRRPVHACGHCLPAAYLERISFLHLPAAAAAAATYLLNLPADDGTIPRPASTAACV